eukprot:TRINITY_DN8353_c0_g1_i1.p6 TRINITY_DN8353_c0_g1~~TRINITY_DN8353_c0_g1_i1.p6  ORF type:complete len:104 (+),score=9.95 TRINITY_DN8353_c0_g1_i1:2629-2940(+)
MKARLHTSIAATRFWALPHRCCCHCGLLAFYLVSLCSRAEASGTFTTKAWIERIVVYGMARPHAVSCAGVNLEFHFDATTSLLEIKKPWPQTMADDFDLTIYV